MSGTNFYSLRIKHVFLSFAQSLFAEHPKYPWTLNPSTNKIIIADAYSVDQATIENFPSIVVKRGALGLQEIVIDQLYDRDLATPDKEYWDILKGSVSYRVVAKNGLVAEHLADYLHSYLIAFKTQFRKNGIQNIRRIVLGEEQIIRSQNEIEMTAIPIDIQFDVTTSLGYSTNPYDLELTPAVIKSGSGLVDDDSTGLFLHSADYTVSGNYIIFDQAPSGTSLNAKYVGAITLDEYDETPVGLVDGANTIFELTEVPYAFWPVVSGITLSIEEEIE